MYDEARSYIKEASDAMFVVNTEGNLLEVNKKAEELTGYTRQELINMNFTRLHPKEELEKLLLLLKKRC